ncbi:MAG TPA: GNAT family N-acetyltransferase [Kofleriaceae bacterium]|nr:GNAT family N-acetyltransferase [Kofleriaceae bacterium]
MEAISLADLEAQAEEIERLALSAPDIDAFCSSPSWILPAAAALMPPGEPVLFRAEAGFLATCLREHELIRVLEPLEAMWGLASPLVGPDPEPLAAAAVEVFRDLESTWDALVLTGLMVDSALLQALVRQLGARYRITLGPQTVRHVASLEGGADGFLARRSRGTRKSLRQSQRRAAQAGITFAEASARDAASADLLFERILEVERRSWKGRAQIGLDTPGMREFYQLMAQRLAAAGRLRVLFARRGDEEDVGYVLGAVFGDTYRGLQFAFDDRFRAIGLGNLSQVEQVRRLEPAIVRYDLGTGGDYKRAWAEDEVTSVALVAVDR